MQFKLIEDQPNHAGGDQLLVAVDPQALYQISQECCSFRREDVELGGLIMGCFDGIHIFIKEFILDEDAESTPVNIRLSTKVFSLVEQRLKELNDGSTKAYQMLGTWHGHSGSYNTPSTTDRTTLFQESMRLRTDDPGLAKAPFVHFIFRDFGRSPNGVRTFTMRLNCTYDLHIASTDIADQPLYNEIVRLIDSGIWLGVLWSEDGGKTTLLKPYHPNTFKQHIDGRGVIHGIWKYYPYRRVINEFEKVFLENFFQKLQVPQFNYIRLLLNLLKEQPISQWFHCQRQSGASQLSKIIDFIELPLKRAFEIKCQNPDTAQTISLVLPSTATVRQIAHVIATESKLSTPPTLFTYFQQEKAKQFSNRALVRDQEVILPDDLILAEIKEALSDPRLPIYYRTVEIDPETLFRLRTLRFHQQGYVIDQLRKAKVLIGGAGLLGGEIAFNLAILGVGNIMVIDNGSVDWYNVYRQGSFSRHDVYRRKVDVVKERLEDMGTVKVEPLFIEVPSWASSLSRKDMLNALSVLDQAITQADIVVGAFDRFSPRAVLQAICLVRNRPFVVSALDIRMGRVVLFDKSNDGCYCCGWPNPEQGRWYDGGVCTLASLESQRIVASLAAKLITDKIQDQEILYNRIDYYPATTRIDPQKVRASEDCNLCSQIHGAARKFQGENLLDSVITWLALDRENNA